MKVRLARGAHFSGDAALWWQRTSCLAAGSSPLSTHAPEPLTTARPSENRTAPALVGMSLPSQTHSIQLCLLHHPAQTAPPPRPPRPRSRCPGMLAAFCLGSPPPSPWRSPPHSHRRVPGSPLGPKAVGHRQLSWVAGAGLTPIACPLLRDVLLQSELQLRQPIALPRGAWLHQDEVGEVAVQRTERPLAAVILGVVDRNILLCPFRETRLSPREAAWVLLRDPPCQAIHTTLWGPAQGFCLSLGFPTLQTKGGTNSWGPGTLLQQSGAGAVGSGFF